MKPIYVFAHPILDITFKLENPKNNQNIPLSYNAMEFYLRKAILKNASTTHNKEETCFPEINGIYVIASFKGLNGYEDDLAGEMNIHAMNNNSDVFYPTKNPLLVSKKKYLEGLIDYITKDTLETKIIVAKNSIAKFVKKDVLKLVGKLNFRNIDYTGIEKEIETNNYDYHKELSPLHKIPREKLELGKVKELISVKN